MRCFSSTAWPRICCIELCDGRFPAAAGHMRSQGTMVTILIVSRLAKYCHGVALRALHKKKKTF